MGFFATVSLVSLWLERYLLVMPSVTALPRPDVRRARSSGPTLLLLGLYLLAYALFARTFPMVSPRLAEITLDRERGHATVSAEFDHEEGPRDYVKSGADRAPREAALSHDRKRERQGGMPMVGMPPSSSVPRLRCPALSGYLLRISALIRRIIARRLSEGRAPVMASIRSPTCMAMA